MSHAGDPARLEAHIVAKSVRAANACTIEVLRDLRIELQVGRLAALVGPSGCGKTTFLRCVAGLDHNFTGTIGLPERARLGFVFQEPRLLPWRTVEENIRIMAPEAETSSIEQLLQALHLAAHRQHYPGELSLGLARRVAIARAFAVEPDLLLLDEPFVSLDGPLAAELKGELKALLARRPVTTLLVTHDTTEAAELADKVVLLSSRPAQVLAEVPIATPRQHRTPAEIAGIAARLDGLLAPSQSQA